MSPRRSWAGKAQTSPKKCEPSLWPTLRAGAICPWPWALTVFISKALSTWRKLQFGVWDGGSRYKGTQIRDPPSKGSPTPHPRAVDSTSNPALAQGQGSGVRMQLGVLGVYGFLPLSWEGAVTGTRRPESRLLPLWLQANRHCPLEPSSTFQPPKQGFLTSRI